MVLLPDFVCVVSATPLFVGSDNFADVPSAADDVSGGVGDVPCVVDVVADVEVVSLSSLMSRKDVGIAGITCRA